MMTDFHFLRPLWLLALAPLIALAIILWQQKPSLQAWGDVCDHHLLEHLLQTKGKNKRMVSMLFVFLSILFMILSIAGPTWYKLPVATYKPIQPRVIVLDMSENMLEKDLTPDRLSRAKFKLHDLFEQKDVGQFGLVVFTGESFVVSPLTDDGQTISALLSTLTPDIMPVSGQRLDAALIEANNIIQQAGFRHGQILVLTADAPSPDAINMAKKLAREGVISSIIPIRADKNLNPLFQRFAAAGDGEFLVYSTDSSDFKQWLSLGGKEEFALSQQDDVPLWRDEGRWFLILALLFLVPVFQRGWLQRVAI